MGQYLKVDDKLYETVASSDTMWKAEEFREMAGLTREKRLRALKEQARSTSANLIDVQQHAQSFYKPLTAVYQAHLKARWLRPGRPTASRSSRT